MIKNLLDDSEDSPAGGRESEKPSRKASSVIGLFDTDDVTAPAAEKAVTLSSESSSLTASESVRQSGMAWSLGVAFFSSVVFMLILGWGADLLFGSSPWGVVSGIVIGSIIGFYQIFRISAQIFKAN